MDLKDLKSAWKVYSSQEVDRHRLGKETIYELLKNRTQTLVDRIDRNIRIGMVVILAFIAYVILDDLYLANLLIQKPLEYPGWLIPLDVVSYVVILTTYLFFVLRYLRIKRSFSPDTQLKDLLSGIINTLKTYRRLFYLAVVILLINIVVSFSAGLYMGVQLQTGGTQGGPETLGISKILSVVGVGLLVLIPMVALTFFLLRWGFNKLYGRYLGKLKDTLQELDESETAE